MYHNVSFDLTTFTGDAIVNSLGAGDFIRRAGRIYYSIINASNDATALMNEVSEKGQNLPFGSVYLTDSFGLPCKKIIHVITPFRRFDRDNSQIAKCYEDLLQLAWDSGLRSISVPLIGTGANGYRSDIVASIARRICYRFAEEHPEMEVFFNIYSVECGLSDEIYSYGRMEGMVRHPESSAPDFPLNQANLPEARISKPHPSFLESIGIEYGDSFATLVRKCVFARVSGTKAEKDEALESVWLEINSLVGDFKSDFAVLSETVNSIHESKEKGLPTNKQLLSGKTSHAPQYEWKKVKNPKGKGYVWQRPNKAEILLACIAMHLKPYEVMEVYEFCGFSLSKYEMYDYAFRECVQLINKKDPWTQIVQRYRNYTSESLYAYREERKKIYVDDGEPW